MYINFRFQIEAKPNGSAANETELKPTRAKQLNGKDEPPTDGIKEWECERGNVKVLKEIERDGFGKISKGSVTSKKDDEGGSVLLRILKGRLLA